VAGARDLRVDRVEQRGERVAVVLSWTEQSGERGEWAHVLRLREGMIVRMQDHAGGTSALRALRRPVPLL
jgi:hypothetical protein